MLDWSKYPNFRPHELCCRCGCGAVDMQPEPMRILQSLRNVIGPLNPTSGFRCEAHNANVSTVSPPGNSPHVGGWAVDIACADSHLRWLIVTELIELGVQRIGIGKDFIHFDCDPTKTKRLIWVY